MLGGILVPVSVLPHWIRPLSSVVFLSWSADLLRAALRPTPMHDFAPRLGMVAFLGACGLAIGVVVDARDSPAGARIGRVGNDVKSLAATARVAWYAIVSGANDYWSIFTLKSWIFGWCVRMISQVSFFALIGKLLRSDEQTQFLLIGNAVMIAVDGRDVRDVHDDLGARQRDAVPPARESVTARRRLRRARRLRHGGRRLQQPARPFILGPAFGLHFPFPRVLLVIPLTLLVGTSAYCFSTFLAGVILRYREITGLVVNATIVTLMALCGVNVPVSFYPTWLEWISRSSRSRTGSRRSAT